MSKKLLRMFSEKIKMFLKMQMCWLQKLLMIYIIFNEFTITPDIILIASVYGLFMEHFIILVFLF